MNRKGGLKLPGMVAVDKSVSSGITPSEKLKNLLNFSSDHSHSIIKVTPSDKSIDGSSLEQNSNTGLREKLNSLRSHTTSSQPCYFIIFYQLEGKAECLFVSFLPDEIAVRSKMIFSTSKGSVKEAIVDMNPGMRVEEYNVSELKQLSFEAYTKHKQVEKPYTEQEKMLMEVEQMETGGGYSFLARIAELSGNGAPVALPGFGIGMKPSEVKKGINNVEVQKKEEERQHRFKNFVESHANSNAVPEAAVAAPVVVVTPKESPEVDGEIENDVHNDIMTGEDDDVANEDGTQDDEDASLEAEEEEVIPSATTAIVNSKTDAGTQSEHVIAKEQSSSMPLTETPTTNTEIESSKLVSKAVVATPITKPEGVIPAKPFLKAEKTVVPVQAAPKLIVKPEEKSKIVSNVDEKTVPPKSNLVRPLKKMPSEVVSEGNGDVKKLAKTFNKPTKTSSPSKLIKKPPSKAGKLNKPGKALGSKGNIGKELVRKPSKPSKSRLVRNAAPLPAVADVKRQEAQSTKSRVTVQIGEDDMKSRIARFANSTSTATPEPIAALPTSKEEKESASNNNDEESEEGKVPLVAPVDDDDEVADHEEEGEEEGNDAASDVHKNVVTVEPVATPQPPTATTPAVHDLKKYEEKVMSEMAASTMSRATVQIGEDDMKARIAMFQKGRK